MPLSSWSFSATRTMSRADRGRARGLPAELRQARWMLRERQGVPRQGAARGRRRSSGGAGGCGRADGQRARSCASPTRRTRRRWRKRASWPAACGMRPRTTATSKLPPSRSSSAHGQDRPGRAREVARHAVKVRRGPRSVSTARSHRGAATASRATMDPATTSRRAEHTGRAVSGVRLSRRLREQSRPPGTERAPFDPWRSGLRLRLIAS